MCNVVPVTAIEKCPLTQSDIHDQNLISAQLKNKAGFFGKKPYANLSGQIRGQLAFVQFEWEKPNWSQKQEDKHRQ